ncbi:MAG: helix-turn-helix domain-containing protein [Lachnospiraceae bacterium]|nr:helix-turn-helix domain-containing protein [Lachnospiraceae bacterium]
MTLLPRKNKLDLSYLCTTIGNMAGVPIRIYENYRMVFYHSIVSLPKDPVLLYEKELLSLTEPVGYFITPNFDYYGISTHENQTIIIGPARLTTPTDQYLRKLAFDLSVEPEDMQLFLSSMKVIIHMPLESILQILCTIHYVISGNKIGLNELSIIDSTQEELSTEMITAQSEFFLENDAIPTEDTHNTYQIEQQLLDMVRRGDTVGLKNWITTAPAIRPGKVAADMLRQLKNTFIISTTLVSRAAIRGGMDLDDALRLSDSYIQKCEQLSNYEQITNLQYHMVSQYTEAVEELRYNRNQSELIKNVASYIRHHLSESIKTEDIAASLYMSRSHLSTRFKAESGINLIEYIHYIKISEAKHLLTYTAKPLLIISNYLGYSSQSHFTRMFKKIVGMSPVEYREKHE